MPTHDAHPHDQHEPDRRDGDDEMTPALLEHPAETEVTRLERMAWRLERDGLTGSDEDVAAVVGLARRSPVSQVLTEVLADESAPAVVRIRAFGKLALQLARL